MTLHPLADTIRSFITVLRSNCNGLKQCISRDITCAYYASCVNTIPRSFVFSIFWPFAPLHQSQLRASQFFFFSRWIFQNLQVFFPFSLSFSLFFSLPLPFSCLYPISRFTYTHHYNNVPSFQAWSFYPHPPQDCLQCCKWFSIIFFLSSDQAASVCSTALLLLFFCFESLGLMRFLVQWRSIDESRSRPAIALRTRVLASLFWNLTMYLLTV